MVETTLSVKGQIVIPRRIREKLRLKAGRKFEVETMSDGTILIIPIPEKIVDLMRLPATEKLERALVEERVKDEERRKGMAKEIKVK